MPPVPRGTSQRLEGSHGVSWPARKDLDQGDVYRTCPRNPRNSVASPGIESEEEERYLSHFLLRVLHGPAILAHFHQPSPFPPLAAQVILIAVRQIKTVSAPPLNPASSAFYRPP